MSQSSPYPVRDDTATVPCPACGQPFTSQGRARYCSTVCRQAAWRRRHAAPAQPVVAKPDTVYACPSCDIRYLGEQYCPDCRTFCQRIGPGGCCPNCDEPVAVTDLLGPEQFASTLPPKSSRRKWLVPPRITVTTEQ